MLTDGAAMVYMALVDCEPVSLGYQYRCLFQGEWVTPWPGFRSASVTANVLGAVPLVGVE